MLVDVEASNGEERAASGISLSRANERKIGAA